MSILHYRPGMILTKNAPTIITKDGTSAVKRGDKVELRLDFTSASLEEIKKAIGPDTPEGYIAGWASTSSRDSYNHEVVNGAFQESIDKRTLSGPQGIKLLLDHDWTKPGGVITVLEYRRGRLWMEAQLNLDVSYVKERYSMIKMMGGANFSVGFMLQDYDVVSKMVDGEEEQFLQINRGDLFEVSVVLFPANEEAQMTFVKAAFHEDNKDEDKLFFAKANTPSWKLGASRDLPLADTENWDGAAAKARIFAAAKFDSDNPNTEMARKAFLVYDSANPTLRGSYKLPFADVIDGKLQATTAGLDAAASRLPNTDVPDTLKTAARAVIDAYEAREKSMPIKNAPKSLAEFEKQLIAKGLAKSRNEAREIALVVKSCPDLFVKKEETIFEPVTLDNGKLTEMLSALMKAKTILTNG